MAVVWKETLAVRDLQEVILPRDAEILSVREQFGAPCIWYRCDPTKPKTSHRQIAMCGTGHAAPDQEEGRYVGTVLLEHGALVLHVFEKI